MDPDIPEVKAAGFLAVVGFFDLAGTTFSGWLTDRCNSRYLLFCSYALRGLTLLFLPSLAHPANGLSFFECFLRPDRRVASARSLACSLRDRSDPQVSRRLSRRLLAFWRVLPARRNGAHFHPHARPRV
jgi:hypothetical protein